MIITLDTNVLFSALYSSKGASHQILRLIIEKFNGGPVGLNTLAAATGEEMATIEDIYEPFLMQMGFLARTPRGRVVTDLGYQHLGYEIPTQDKLI